jgi:hypothetical protein
MEFLGLEWQSRQEQFSEHASAKRLYSPTLYEVRQGLSTRALGKWRRFGLDYSAGEPRLSSLLREFGYEADHDKSKSILPAAGANSCSIRISDPPTIASPSAATQSAK